MYSIKNKIKKLNIGIIFGGISPEHEVSILSTKNIINFIDKKKFNIFPIEIDKEGTWNIYFINNFLKKTNMELNIKEKIISFFLEKNSRYYFNTSNKRIKIDIIFPVIHGITGEDGSLQGFFQTLHIPYIGSNIIGSAINFNKSIMKCLLRDSGIEVVPFILIEKNTNKVNLFQNIKYLLGETLFIKPNSMGSSIGVSKVRNKKEFDEAILLAFRFGEQVLIESAIECREIECGIIGNKKIKISVLGEISYNDTFYTYYTKYSSNDTHIQIPANISKKTEKKIINLAKKAFRILNCSDMARIDFFLTKEEKIYINEINTIPGFSKNSIFPRLWQNSGINLQKLITKLIYFGYQRHKSEKDFCNSFKLKFI